MRLGRRPSDEFMKETKVRVPAGITFTLHHLVKRRDLFLVYIENTTA